MPSSESAFYRSSNGDQWFLVKGTGLEPLHVRHQPNKASGGQSSTMEITEFLSEGPGPQHDALVRLLGSNEEK
jgi:hypothetical protein